MMYLCLHHCQNDSAVQDIVLLPEMSCIILARNTVTSHYGEVSEFNPNSFLFWNFVRLILLDTCGLKFFHSKSTAILAFGWIWPYVTGITLRMLFVEFKVYNVYRIIDLLPAKEMSVLETFSEIRFLLTEAIHLKYFI